MSVVAEGIAFVPGTCGELLQGVDARGPVLVSLPVELYGTVRVALTDEPSLTVVPALPKATAALHIALERSGWKGGVRIQLGGELPHSRGMGSSTADVAGVIGGVCACAGVALTQRELLRLLVQVEPSDSSPLSGLWAVDHVAASFAARVAASPGHVYVAMVDSMRDTATLAVHAALGPGPCIPDGTLRRTRWDDWSTIGRVATESARRNQSRLPNPALDVACAVAERVGAAGVCVAHSGSVCGVLCPVGLVQALKARDEFTRTGLHARILRVRAPGLRVRVSDRPRSRQWRARLD